MTQPRLINLTTGVVAVERLAFAATFWTRFRGLQFRKSLPDNEGILIVPCRSIHTHWMRFAIDVTMVNQEGVVVKFHPGVKPWRMLAASKWVSFVLETNAGSGRVSDGDRLGIDAKTNSASVPDAVRHLVCT